ncbi:hypothetical protein LCGC14_2173350 [marine sediment metagenome]|uniref:Uncharacterized protein n=1 Tax=marine sediment metagenome TaxID=412755 RepID=A0A0F9DPA4_9ZZZZ
MATQLMGQAVTMYAERFFAALQRNPNNQDSAILGAAVTSMARANHRVNRWVMRIAKRLGVSDEEWLRMARVLEDINRRHLGLIDN